MKTLIYPVAKSPTQTIARIGKKKIQDWHRALALSVAIMRDLQAKGVSAGILIVTGFQMKGHRAEAKIFIEELKLFGVKQSEMIVEERGFHTGDQVHIAEEIAKGLGSKLISISTLFHFWHVKYYSSPETEHRVAYGMPNLKEAIKDPFMHIFAWIVDRRFEWRLSFEEWIYKRRSSGDL